MYLKTNLVAIISLFLLSTGSAFAAESIAPSDMLEGSGFIEKMVQRASYLEKISTEEYRSLSKKRNGVEGLPSVLRRRYHVDTMPVRGYVRSKIWFSLKIGAINVKRVLKRVSILHISKQKRKNAPIISKQRLEATESRLVAA